MALQSHVSQAGHLCACLFRSRTTQHIFVLTTAKLTPSLIHFRCLGSVGYYRSFYRNFSTIVAPLTDVLKGTVKFAWSPAGQKAVEQVKGLLCSASALSAPYENRPFKLFVDASNIGVGSVLMQASDKPISFFSKIFNSCQLNYSLIEKEHWH